MKTAPTIRPIIATLTALLIACGDDTAAPEVEPLTQVEVNALMAAINALGATEGGGTDEELELGTTSSTVPCPLGGQMSITGQVVDMSPSDGIRFDFDFTMPPQGCQVRGNGMTFTLDGSPNLRQVGAFEVEGFFESLTLDISLVGTLGWKLGTRSGRCAIDLSGTARADDSGESGTLSGTVCGVDYSQDLTTG